MAGQSFEFTFDDDGRSSDGCGCSLAVVFVVVAAIMAGLWLFTHRRQVELALLAACLLCALYFARGRIFEALQRRRSRTVVDPSAQPTPLANVKPGQVVHTAGLAGVGAAPTHAPLGGPACAFFRVEIARLEPHEVIYAGRSSEELVLDDGSGAKLSVQLEGARWSSRGRKELIASPELPDATVATFLAERGIAVDFAVRARLDWVAPHELVFVRGLVRESAPAGDAGYRTAEQTRFEIAATPEHPLVLALVPLGANAKPT